MKRFGHFMLGIVCLFFVACNESSPYYGVFHYPSKAADAKIKLYDFNGEISAKGVRVENAVLCRQQESQYEDVYYAVFPGGNYVGLHDGELEIRLPQHQRYLPCGVDDACNPKVAFEKIKRQKYKHVNGGIRFGLKGDAFVTALRFADNDTLDRLWGNFVVRNPGSESQQVFALSSDEGDNMVWLDCGEGLQLSPDTATVFSVMLPPGAFYRGFSMDVFSGDSLLYHAESECPNAIIGDCIIQMPTLNVAQAL